MLSPVIPGDRSRRAILPVQPGDRSSGRSVRQLPVVPFRAHTSGAHYALRPVDSRGRITDRDLAARMGWVPGQRLRWELDSDVVVLSPDDSGRARVTPSGYLSLPARCRQATATHTGDRLLFVVRSGSALLIAMPPAVVDEMVTARLAELADGGVA